MKKDQLSVNIYVAPLKDNDEISFGTVELYHAQCREIPMQKHRNVASGDYNLKCVCGLEITLPPNSDAQEKIIKVAIAGVPEILERGSFYANQNISSVKLTINA